MAEKLRSSKVEIPRELAETPDLAGPATVDESIRRNVGQALPALSAVYGIKPPIVEVYKDYREFLDRAGDVNTEWNDKITAHASMFGDSYENAKKGILDKVHDSQYMDRRFTSEFLAIPGGASIGADKGEADALIWVDPLADSNEQKDFITAEAGHAVTIKVQRLTGKMIPKEADEALEYIHKSLQKKQQTPDPLGEIMEDVSLSMSFALTGKYGGHIEGHRMFQEITDKFQKPEDMKDIAVIVATTEEKEYGHRLDERSFKDFIGKIAQDEARAPGTLRKRADDIRGMLAEGDKRSP